MRLAANFALQLGSKAYTLRPTLRAAFDLNQKYNGFHNISRYLAEGSLTTAVDLINATIVDPQAWAAYALAGNAVVRDLMAAHDQLQDFVLVLTGANDKADDKPQTGQPISFEEYFTELYRLATGWLGWSPADAWDATPAEILNAQQGRVAMLKAIFGGNKDDQSADMTDSSAKADLNAIGDLTNHVRPR